MYDCSVDKTFKLSFPAFPVRKIHSKFVLFLPGGSAEKQ
jgi:hypothetical protein